MDDTGENESTLMPKEEVIDTARRQERQELQTQPRATVRTATG